MTHKRPKKGERVRREAHRALVEGLGNVHGGTTARRTLNGLESEEFVNFGSLFIRIES